MLYSTLLNLCLKVHDDVCESDHFPIILKNLQSSNKNIHDTNVKRLLDISTNNFRCIIHILFGNLNSVNNVNLNSDSAIQI